MYNWNMKTFFTITLLILIVPAISGCSDEIVESNEIEIEMTKLKQMKGEDIKPNHYPQDYGIDGKNNQKIIREYHCNDMCPDYGHVILQYKNINSPEECEKVRGVTTMHGIPDSDNFKACLPAIK